jgi:uncharacterized membrane protein
MTATFAPSLWPSPAGPSRVTPLVFARQVEADSAGAPALQWLLKRNCSITPRQLVTVYSALSAVSLAIGLLFLWLGAPYVLAFAGLELVAVGAALVVFARHAADRDTLTLVGRSLHVELKRGAHVDRAEFAADWLTVEPAAGQGSLVELAGQGQRVRVGRFLRPELRAAFARELRAALRRARQAT